MTTTPNLLDAEQFEQAIAHLKSLEANREDEPDPMLIADPIKKVAKVLLPKTPKAPTKQSIANEIVRAAQAIAKTTGGVVNKRSVIETIMNDVGMSEAGATTYYYNAVKAIARGR